MKKLVLTLIVIGTFLSTAPAPAGTESAGYILVENKSPLAIEAANENGTVIIEARTQRLVRAREGFVNIRSNARPGNVFSHLTANFRYGSLSVSGF